MHSPQRPQRSEVRKLHDCLQELNFLHRLRIDELGKLLDALKKRSVPAGITH
jgi:hypothetical protein